MDIRKGRHNPFHLFTQTWKYAVLGSVLLSCLFALNHIQFSDYFPIKTVRIYGANRTDHQEIQSILLPLVDRGFFTIDVDHIRDRLFQIPWVSTIFVRRTWPDQVDITVIEKNAVARWNEQSLLSEAGELFSPRKETYPVALPKFNGPDGQHILMLRYFNSMNRLLAPLHARISALEMTPYYSWKVTLNNGITLQIGHKDVLTRLNHFVKVYPKIVRNRVADVESIDLRYPNGVAVRWRKSINV